MLISIKKICSLILPAAILFLVFTGPAGADVSRIQWSWEDEETKARPVYTARDDASVLLSRPSFERPSVVELGEEGEIIWSMSGFAANSIEKLEDGNYLIADTGAPGDPHYPRVVEITADEQVVWEYRFATRADAPRRAVRLKNGNTLVVTASKVLEIDAGGQVVWQFGSGLWQAVYAERLENGNTLIVDRGIILGAKVLEIDPAGEIVWSFSEGLEKPVSAVRLENGNTVIADLNKYWKVEVTPDNEVVRVTSWRQVLAGLGFPQQRFARPLQEGGTLVTAGNKVMLIDDRSIEIYLNGEWLAVPKTPVIVENKVLIPVRPLADKLEWQMHWEAAAKLLTVSSGGIQAEMTLDSTTAVVDDREVELDTAPRLTGNTLMVPVGFLVETFGLEMNWDSEARILELWRR